MPKPRARGFRNKRNFQIAILPFAIIASARSRLTWNELGMNNRSYMPALLLFIFRFVRLLLSGHQAIAIENAALRLQLAAFQRERKQPVLTTLDRVFWITLRRLWSGWRRPLLYVQPDTVAGWQRERFRRFWARLSKRHGRRRGRPATAVEIRRLIEQMVVANPLWRAPRIHGELKMLGIAISERTVSRILRGLRQPPTQTWKTFLHNHLGQLVSIDFFTRVNAVPGSGKRESTHTLGAGSVPC
jgi:hypothetical protein